ncbi:20186_t:CDS:2 [Racocetra persica]|uniref:20186_t:CDS:1 n=2 Tax=Racocetra persica TaxID=160502 RepID=A0ACA9LZY3_9GLOM|nr:20185_t:CDS:2 [Racocetra persica]CAG8559359.1 20186_t:CDS:2 [Racocetra persica]
MTIKLVGFPISTATLRVIICLKELAVPYELDPPPSFQSIKDDDYIANKHPFGRIPVLFDDDFRITESRAICRYLTSKYQGKYNNTILIPNDVHKAGLVEQYISYESFYYDPPVSTIVFEEVFAKKYVGNEPNAEAIKQSREDLSKVLDVYEKLLEGKEYLTGEFSLVDIFHCPGTNLACGTVTHADLWDKRPNVKNWWNRLCNREAIKKSFEEIES